MVNGQYLNMSSIRRELEQQFQRRGLECQLEQQPDELEQQCGLSGGLQLHLKSQVENSGATGIYCPALCEINTGPLFGRSLTEDQWVS